ncbi:MAG: neutral/alkaline non-lysosomal ceramidase N-terminal domain-containing protein, partial [Planctomycetota bacterium]
MFARPHRNAFVQGIAVLLLGAIGACLLPVRPACGDESAGTLKAGMAKVVITPPVGTRLSGYANRTQPSIEVLDDLYAKALVLDNGTQRVALVVCDIIGFRGDMVNEMRGLIHEQTGIEPDHVMITCTHTHTGPNLSAADGVYIDSLKARVAEA